MPVSVKGRRADRRMDEGGVFVDQLTTTVLVVVGWMRSTAVVVDCAKASGTAPKGIHGSSVTKAAMHGAMRA